MHIAHKHIVALSMLGAVCAALALPRAAVAEDACSFDYVIADGIIPTAFMEVTHTLAERSDMMRAMHAALPNVRRVFAANTGYTALIGWAELPEDYSQYSSMQAVRKLVDIGDGVNEETEVGECSIRLGMSRGVLYCLFPVLVSFNKFSCCFVVGEINFDHDGKYTEKNSYNNDQLSDRKFSM